MKKTLFLAFILLSALGCRSDNPKNKSITLHQLENNQEISLEIESIEKPDLIALNQNFSEASKEEIEKLLNKKGLNFFEASYGLHYMGNRYFAENNFEKGMYYQHLAADKYLNPYAMLWLAIMYSKTKKEIASSLPEGMDIKFERDYEKSFHYMIWALNTAVLTMEYFEDRSIVNDVNKYCAPLIKLYERRDSSILKDFDIVKAEEKAKKELPEIKAAFLKMYKPKKKEAADTKEPSLDN